MQLGRYELLEVVGKGGFGVVYRALDTALQVERALKVLHPALIVDPEMASRFKREAQVAAQLEHPHIVPVYDIGEVENRIFLAMKYLPGGSLKERLAEGGPLPYAEALDILRQIVGGVGFAHQHDIIHRDLKPGNILFDENGQVRVSDFGFAKVLSGTQSATLTMSGGILGTPAYMAPELWNGTPPPSTATDVYAIACVFYEMLTGKVLFEGETPMAVMARHARGPEFEGWESLSSTPNLDISHLESALKQDPAERIASPEDFYHHIQEPTSSGKNEPQSTLGGKPPVITADVNHGQDETAFGNSEERKKFWGSFVSAQDKQDITLTDREIVSATLPEHGKEKPSPKDQRQDGRKTTSKKPSQTTGVAGKSSKKGCLLSAGIIGLVFLVSVLIMVIVSFTQSKKARDQATIISDANTWANSTREAEENAAAINEANLIATEKVEKTATASVQTTAMARAAWQIFDSYATSGNLVFNESSGVMENNDDGYLGTFWTDTELKNFALEVTFENPYSTDLGEWDYGILFRHVGSNDQFRLTLDSDQVWALENWEQESHSTVSAGSVMLNTNKGETNHFQLVALDEVGYLFVNHQFISQLDLSDRDIKGHVLIATDFYGGIEIEGYETSFANLKIYDIDQEQPTKVPTAATQTSLPTNTISINSQTYEVTSSSPNYTYYRYNVFFENTEQWDDIEYSLMINQDRDYNDYYLCEFDQYKPSPCEFRDHQGITYLYCFEEITMYWKLSEIKCAYDIKLYGSDDSLVYRYRHYHTFEND